MITKKSDYKRIRAVYYKILLEKLQ